MHLKNYTFSETFYLLRFLWIRKYIKFSTCLFFSQKTWKKSRDAVCRSANCVSSHRNNNWRIIGPILKTMHVIGFPTNHYSRIWCHPEVIFSRTVTSLEGLLSVYVKFMSRMCISRNNNSFGHTTTSTFTKQWLFSRGKDGIVRKFTIARRRIRNGMDVVD